MATPVTRVQSKAYCQVWNPDKAASIATDVLTEYVGVSAQFVVEDAMAMIASAKNGGGDSGEMQLRSFLINLSGLLPPGLPNDRIREMIFKRYPRN